MKYIEWQRVYKFAKEKHAGQKDDAGQDYFDAHIMQVADLVSTITPDKTMISAALLHDTLEDTETTEEELREQFGDVITDLVVEVTHTDERNGDGAPVFANLHSRNAILIKFADRLSNLLRMDPWDAERQQKYIDRSRFWITDKDERKTFIKEMK